VNEQRSLVGLQRGEKERLPYRRAKATACKAVIGGTTVFLHCGEYEDGRLGEVFIDVHKVGTFGRGALTALAITTSKALQYGTPLNEIVDSLMRMNFPPGGMVEGDNDIKFATSILDWIARRLAIDYLGRVEESVQNQQTEAAIL
jgi:ribonucleoside-diphosphate reductase alpha chain